MGVLLLRGGWKSYSKTSLERFFYFLQGNIAPLVARDIREDLRAYSRARYGAAAAKDLDEVAGYYFDGKGKAIRWFRANKKCRD